MAARIAVGRAPLQEAQPLVDEREGLESCIKAIALGDLSNFSRGTTINLAVCRRFWRSNQRDTNDGRSAHAGVADAPEAL